MCCSSCWDSFLAHTVRLWAHHACGLCRDVAFSVSAIFPQVLLDICDGLRFCHEGCGGVFGGEILLHRDLKPENVLLRRDPETDEIVAALGDFGISKLLPASTAEGHASTRNLMGTLG